MGEWETKTLVSGTRTVLFLTVLFVKGAPYSRGVIPPAASIADCSRRERHTHLMREWEMQILVSRHGM